MKKYGIGGNNVNCPVYGVGGVLSSCKTYGNNSVIADLSPKLWCRQGVGITEVGAGVSQWDDQSGNGNHLKQATDLDRPQKQTDGSILTDGISQFLKADAFTLVQPETMYVLVNLITWTSGDTVFDGNTLNSGRLFQTGTTPNIGCYAGDVGANSTDLPLNTYGVIAVVFDHDNALNTLQVDNNAPSTDTSFGINDMGGLTLGVNGGLTQFAHMQVKECLVYSAAHDAATRAKVIAYLQSI